MTRCQWCAGVFNADGSIVDPKPEHWGSLPSVACELCARLEKICTKEPEAAARVRVPPLPRVLKVNQRRLAAVSAGRSCLPAGDRD